MNDASNQSSGNAKPLVFVVDDEPLLLELAATLLESLCHVKTFGSAEAAGHAYAEARPRPALVITDYAMHQMNGLDLINECRRIEPRQKILLLSGTVDESVYHESPVKPDRFLPKPYKPREFIATVQALLAR